jgi:hypothetical protein
LNGGRAKGDAAPLTAQHMLDTAEVANFVPTAAAKQALPRQRNPGTARVSTIQAGESTTHEGESTALVGGSTTRLNSGRVEGGADQSGTWTSTTAPGQA